MSKLTVLGLDPGFASMGWAVMQWDGGWSVLRAGVWETKPSAKKLRMLQCEDNSHRAFALCRSTYTEIVSDNWAVDLICYEAPSFPRNASVAAKMGIVYGIVWALIEQYQMCAYQLSPQQIKKALCGKVSASKADVQDAVAQRVHDVRCVELTVKSKRNHIYDAIAAVLAADNSDVMRVIKRREDGNWFRDEVEM